MHFWKLDTLDDRHGKDGSHCILEVYDKGNRYHVIDRWSPGYKTRSKYKHYIGLINYLIDLADIGDITKI